MKFLIYEWNGYCQDDLRETLVRMGHRVERIGYVVREKCEDSYFEECLAKKLKQGFDAVMSFNFFPSVAKCCYAAGIRYLAWIYDGEDQGLCHTSIYLSTSHIFTFETAARDRLLSEGVPNVWYMPLAVNTMRLDAMTISEKEKQLYSGDVSFVGGLYLKKDSLYRVEYSPYWKGFLEGIYQVQKRINYGSFLRETLNNELVETLTKDITVTDPRYTLTKKGAVLNLMATALTQQERLELLSEVSKHYPLDLYTYEKTTQLESARLKGAVNYYTQMPKVFRCSRINLNISHRMITTGIPLRVLDVLGAGGFLITNYQSDMGEKFIDGENLAMYFSKEELIDKIEFYLVHEEERKKIAQKGHDLICAEFTYEKQIAKLFECVGLK